MTLKRSVIDWLGRLGIQVVKAPSATYTPIPVFQLAVQQLAQLRGNALTFIQVGANDGIFGDPVRYYIMNHGWRGILVEPQPDVFARLKENLPGKADRLIFENIAIGSSGSELVLYRAPATHLRPGDGMPHSLTVTSSNPHVVARQTGIAERNLVKLTVPAITLDELADRHGFTQFDVLQIDVEGFDLHVLKTLSLSRFRPGIIQFEHGHLTRAQLNEAATLLSAHDYVIYYGGRACNDSVAMPRELFRFDVAR